MSGKLTFHRIGRLTALDVDEVLAAVQPLVDRRFRASGESDDDSMADDAWANEAPLLAGLAAASVQGPNVRCNRTAHDRLRPPAGSLRSSSSRR